MQYFENFPTLYYTFDKDQQEFYTLRNIFTRINILSSVLQNSQVYYKYSMTDRDTLQSVAYKYYGDPLRWWIILLANVMIDPYFDVVLNNDDFQAALIVKYGSIEAAQNTLALINRTTTVTTSLGISSNVTTYQSTLTDTGLTYDFRLNQLVQQTLPTIANPIVQVSNSTVTTPDGATVQTVVTLNAVTAYDNEVAINEAKREIVLVDASYADQLETEFQSLLGS